MCLSSLQPKSREQQDHVDGNKSWAKVAKVSHSKVNKSQATLARTQTAGQDLAQFEEKFPWECPRRGIKHSLVVSVFRAFLLVDGTAPAAQQIRKVMPGHALRTERFQSLMS